MAPTTNSDDLPTLPVLWEVHEIARLIGWARRRMQRLLASELGIATKLGHRWVVCTDDLREKFPQAYKELKKRLETGELPQHQPGRPQRVKTAA